MPVDLLKDFINKECIITLMNESRFQITGKILGTEGYWIKIQEKDSNRIINGAIVRDIKIKLEKTN